MTFLLKTCRVVYLNVTFATVGRQRNSTQHTRILSPISPDKNVSKLLTFSLS